MPEKFDFSKIEDREKFEKLSKKEQGEISDEAQKEASEVKYGLEHFLYSLSKWHINSAVDDAEKFNLPNKMVQEFAQKEFINCLFDSATKTAFEIQQKFSLPQEMVQEKAKEAFIGYLPKGDLEYFIRTIKEKFSLADDFIFSPEVQEILKQRLIYSSSLGWYKDIILLKEKHFLSEEILSSVEVQKAISDLFRNLLFDEKDSLDEAFKIINSIPLPENEIFQQIKKRIKNLLLLEGDLHKVERIIHIFPLPESFFQDKDLQKAAQESFRGNLQYGNFQGAIWDSVKIKELFKLPRDFVINSLKEIIPKRLLESNSNGFDAEVAIKLKNNLDKFFNSEKQSIFSPEMNHVFQQSLMRQLEFGNAELALKIKNEFDIQDEFINSEEVKGCLEQGIIYALLRGDYKNAMKIVDVFDLDIDPEKILKKIPEIEYRLLSKLRKISPEFCDRALRSTKIIINLASFINKPEKFLTEVSENQFLLVAISENLNFGSLLLVKYSQFDKRSKENISTLLDIKKQILLKNPEMNPESLEFRQLMQEKLKGYENNPEILKELQKQGIDVNEWLNYSETRYFNLESGGSHLTFSETVSTPIDRIKETLDSYGHTLKEVLKQYRPELSKFKIPLEDTKEIEEKIAQMQVEMEKAKSEGNEKKAQGIERGIGGLKKKIENIKTVALWDKLLGDISAFQQLKNDVFQAQENLIKAENELQEKLSGKMPSGRMIQELKEKISKAKEELRSKFSVLEKRIDYFKDHLWTTLSPCLGDDTTGALMQEIQTNLAEQFDHYDEDRDTLSNLFSEKTDKEKEKMENRPMSIFVWARNPDIDLYQGNYSPCCIRIDSEHMGAESTIADYNTDLGIQIVNIWDETKNEPVTAAWCWIGKNEKGEMALVVDNIESNTLYSANYSEQLSKELFDYLKDYAKSIGVKKVVLGKANNDLPTSGELAKMKDDESKYEKVGGYNRPDGYFLEAEDKTVILLWENLEPIEKVMQKVEKVAKVEFKDLNIKNLSEKDFAKIKQLEKKIYKDTGLALGQAMIEDMKKGNGLEYSIVASGKRPAGKRQEAIGYLVAMEDETDEGDLCIYLEDIALLPEAQGQQIGWDMLKNLIAKLKEKAKKENKPVLLDMHLRETSQRFFERYQNELEQMGVKLIEEALVPDYYDEDEDAQYKVYEISPNNL